MLAAYNTIANGGTYVAPKLVAATIDDNGKQHATPPSARHQVVSPTVARDMTAMLSQVVAVGTGKGRRDQQLHGGRQDGNRPHTPRRRPRLQRRGVRVQFRGLCAGRAAGVDRHRDP